MKPILSLALLSAALLARPCLPSVRAQSAYDQIEVARSVIKADRQAIIAAALELTDIESLAFWPVYHQYRTAMDAIGRDLSLLVVDYAALYPEVPEDTAREMMKAYLALERKFTSTRASHLKKIGKVLPASKALRFAQIENRLDLALRLELAAGIPLVPTAAPTQP